MTDEFKQPQQRQQIEATLAFQTEPYSWSDFETITLNLTEDTLKRIKELQAVFLEANPDIAKVTLNEPDGLVDPELAEEMQNAMRFDVCLLCVCRFGVYMEIQCKYDSSIQAEWELTGV